MERRTICLSGLAVAAAALALSVPGPAIRLERMRDYTRDFETEPRWSRRTVRFRDTKSLPGDDERRDKRKAQRKTRAQTRKHRK